MTNALQLAAALAILRIQPETQEKTKKQGNKFLVSSPNSQQ